jgi:hypothetical protein
LRAAKEQPDMAHILVQALSQILGEVGREEQEQLVMALIDRVDVDKDNQVSINLRLDPEAIRARPNLQQASSHPPESQPSNGSQQELSGSSRNCRKNGHFVSIETGVEGVKVSINSISQS